MAKTRTRIIADDLFAHVGAAVGITELAKYLGLGRTAGGGQTKAREIVSGLQPIIGQGKGKRYFYLDIAERMGEMGQ